MTLTLTDNERQELLSILNHTTDNADMGDDLTAVKSIIGKLEG